MRLGRSFGGRTPWSAADPRIGLSGLCELARSGDRARTRGSALLILLLIPALFAADRPRPPLVEMARAAPPEFFADAVLRLIQGGKIPQRDLQIELLEDAFSAAAGAAEPLRLVALPGTPPDTREIYRSKAASLALDALSLESRIVRELATLDQAKARELFEHLPRPHLDPRPCTDPLIADAGAYYDAAAAIAQSGFTAKEKRSELHVQFLATVLAGAQSPNELAAFAHALQSVALSADQLRLLTAALEAKLENIRPDYRAFAMSLDALQSELAPLAGSDELIAAFRRHLVNQLKAARCSPDLPLGLQEIAWLHPPLGDDEMRPASRAENFKTGETYFDGDSRVIRESLDQLRGARENRHGVFDNFLNQFASWRPAGSAIDVFHQQSAVLAALLSITPSGPDRDRIMKMCAAFLDSSGAERAHPAEWLWEARAMVDMAGSDAWRLAALFESSRTVSLSLYARLGYFGVSSGTSK